MGRGIQTMGLSTLTALIFGLAFPAPALAGTRHSCALPPRDSSFGTIAIAQSETEVTVGWSMKGTTTLNCPPGDSADEQAIDVWESAYLTWTPEPGGTYETEGKGRAHMRFQNPIIFDSDGSITGAGVTRGPVACASDVCDLEFHITVVNRTGLRARLTAFAQANLATNEVVALSAQDDVMTWIQASS